MFSGDREAFPKLCSFRNEKLVVSGCVGFPSRDELGVGGGGRRPSPSDGVVLPTPLQNGGAHQSIHMYL